MSDIEDEVKCSECPNARHGFDRNASHNAGRYVCQCESHKCTAESLRQQLKHMTDQYNAALEAEQVRYQQLCTFEAAVRHVTEEGKTKRSFSTSEGWAMVHKDRLTDLEIAEEQLAASQAREQQLRAHLEVITGKRMSADNCLGNVDIAELALALPQDTTAIEAMITKAGEVMRERCESTLETIGAEDNCYGGAHAIRAMPGVTLEDLK